jgi:hypothetical protein
MATGYVNSAAGAIEQSAMITNYEAKINVSDTVVVGGIGVPTTEVAQEISNGIVKFLVTATAAVDITNEYDAGDVITGVTLQTANGEAAPA